MKAKIILIILSFIYIVSNAQNNNPYEEFGHKTNVVFESKVSEFLYIINKDTLSQTKAIAFNIEDGLILFLGNNDSVINISIIQPEQLLHWFSIDPLANKYAGWSPYNFCANNPIYIIDPDGKAIRAANDKAYDLLIAVFSKFDTKINGETATGAELFGFSSKIPRPSGKDEPIFSTEVALDQFQQNLANSNLTSKQKKDAEALFKVLSSKDVIEIGIIDEKTTKNGDNKGGHTDIKYITENKDADELLSMLSRGNATNIDIRKKLLSQKISGKLNKDEAYGYYENEHQLTNQLGLKGMILVNDNGTFGNDFTFNYNGNESQNRDFDTARDAMLNAIVAFSKK